jgi:hypothetical protein
MSAIIPTTAPPINPTSSLVLTEAEVLVVQSFTRLYKEGDKMERYLLLKSTVLPRLYGIKSNQDLPPSAWKVRKSVSKQ